MRKIYLTVNVNVNDDCFNNLKNIEKLNFGEIPSISELKKERGEIIAERIIETKGDLLIGFAIQELDHLVNILEFLKEKELYILRIYHANDERRKESINEYKKKYAVNSRWLDNPLEFVIIQDKIFEKKVTQIREEAIRNNIDVLAI